MWLTSEVCALCARIPGSPSLRQPSPVSTAGREGDLPLSTLSTESTAIRPQSSQTLRKITLWIWSLFKQNKEKKKKTPELYGKSLYDLNCFAWFGNLLDLSAHGLAILRLLVGRKRKPLLCKMWMAPLAALKRINIWMFWLSYLRQPVRLAAQSPIISVSSLFFIFMFWQMRLYFWQVICTSSKDFIVF